ncbi:HugZ family protein [Sinirhodobacter populi]|uniref:HugZ family protein n=1 Tax=Paenirhodobacter populi TaxID=2306993 RepID=A0A443JZT7_9RHOB|nr:pyridoxamine 5'-phosphate oxidase family protein [Sinirhodobacter populi]RWR26027.1 HugZ family protein [Sinirhodobacter populi]
MALSEQAITPRGIEINTAAGAPFDARGTARNLLHETRVAALSCTDPGGFPYGTVTNIIVEPDGTPAFFAAGLTLHARNLLADDRLALTLAAFGQADVLTRPRLTLVGRAVRLAPEEAEPVRRRYLARYPKAKLYLSLPDALMFRVTVSGVQINGGPARNAAQIGPEDLRIDIMGAEDLISAEADLLDRLNAGSGLASRAAARAGRWRFTGIDPEGATLDSGKESVRLWFGTRVTRPDDAFSEIERLSHDVKA